MLTSGIKTAGRNINNLRYTDDTTIMAESKEELKSVLMNVEEQSERAVLKLNIQGRRQDGRGVGGGKHFLPHKFIKRAFKRRVIPQNNFWMPAEDTRHPEKQPNSSKGGRKKY